MNRYIDNTVGYQEVDLNKYKRKQFVDIYKYKNVTFLKRVMSHEYYFQIDDDIYINFLGIYDNSFSAIRAIDKLINERFK